MRSALPVRRLGYVGLGIALAMAVVTYLVTASSTQAAANTPLVPRFTAVQLVNGIMFQDGVVATYLAKDAGASLDDAQRALEKDVDAAVVKDAAWADSFADRIQSGDHLKVQAALRDLGALYRGVLDKQFGSKVVDRALGSAAKALEESSTAADPYTANYQININYEINYVAVDLAIEIAALIVIVLLFPVAPSTDVGPTGAGAQLSIEKFVDRIATTLAAA